jgi:hypothetical protein
MTRAQTLGNLHQGTRNTNILRQGTFKIPNTILRRSKLRHRTSDAASIYRKKRSEIRNNFDEPQTFAQLGELFANVDFQKALSKEIVDRVARDKRRAAGNNNDETSSTTGSTTSSSSAKQKSLNKPRSAQIPNIGDILSGRTISTVPKSTVPISYNFPPHLPRQSTGTILKTLTANFGSCRFY